MQIPGNTQSICAFGAKSNDNQSVIGGYFQIIFYETNKKFLVLCANGCYYKYLFNSRGDISREVYSQFLEMTDDKM